MPEVSSKQQKLGFSEMEQVGAKFGGVLLNLNPWIL